MEEDCPNETKYPNCQKKPSPLSQDLVAYTIERGKYWNKIIDNMYFLF